MNYDQPKSLQPDFRQQQAEEYKRERSVRQELLRRRFNDPDVKKTFRNAYTFKIGMDYTTLSPYCENIIMATEGFADQTDRAREKLEKALSDYDSDKDVIVVVGRAFDNLLVGMIVAQKILQKPIARQSFAIAVYYASSYKFYEIFLDPSIESHEIYIR